MLGPITRHKLGRDQMPQPGPLVRRFNIKPLLRDRSANLNRGSDRTEPLRPALGCAPGAGAHLSSEALHPKRSSHLLTRLARERVPT